MQTRHSERLQWGTQQREGMRETGSKHWLSTQSLESALKAEQPATGGFEAGTRWDKGFGFFFHFCVYKLHPESCPISQMGKAARHKCIPTGRENQPTACSLLMKLPITPWCFQVENTNVVTFPLWILLAAWNCSFEIQFLLFLLNTLHLHLEQIMALPMGRKAGNRVGYLFCSLTTLHLQENNKEAQETKRVSTCWQT